MECFNRYFCFLGMDELKANIYKIVIELLTIFHFLSDYLLDYSVYLLPVSLDVVLHEAEESSTSIDDYIQEG